MEKHVHKFVPQITGDKEKLEGCESCGAVRKSHNPKHPLNRGMAKRNALMKRLKKSKGYGE